MSQPIKSGSLTVEAQTPSGPVKISGSNLYVEKDGESIIVTESKGYDSEKVTVLPPGSTVTIKPL
ncbi:MAG: hypothetical protein A2W51_00615 [Candidatus Zambryskibacteria bacterium RIFCSPHIGHO2_02_39_10]|nr:MAG: hypothetical protein A2W51_00615 [Candidatus Zambryskibacteria bacterium RIFCSPHIGHO2_02_39_10]